MYKKYLALLIALTLSTVVFAQVPARAAKPDAAANAVAGELQKAAKLSSISPDATSACAYTFTSGGTATTKYMQYCVTINGNIVEFQSPAGAEYIRLGSFGEGYGICDFTTSARYDDYADFGDSGNWQAPVLLSQSGTAVKIARTTADGIWTLTQTITQVAASATAKVTMALKNNTLATRSVYLLRWADVDANNTFANNMDGTTDSAWGYNASLGRGLMLTRATPNAFSHNGWARNTAAPPDPCNLDPNYVGTLTATDGSIVLYHGMNIGGLKTATVNLSYFAF